MTESKALEPLSFSGLEFADNPQPRCACMLLLDTSGSMSGRKIQQLNEGVRQFKRELQDDDLAQKRVEIAVVTFGPVQVVNQFITADSWAPQELHTTGATPMGEAIERGLELVEQRKQTYRENGVAMYRPWVILMTDGSPTDSVSRAKKLVHDGEGARKFAFFAIGVEGADMNELSAIAVPSRPPLALDGYKFREFFLWLSSSMKNVSRSSPSASTVSLPPTSGWAQL